MDKTLIHCPSEHGHYGTYVKYILDYVAKANVDPTRLVVLAPHGFRHKRADVVSQAASLGVKLEYYAPFRSRFRRLDTFAAPLRDWQTASIHATRIGVQRVVFLNFDALVQMRLPLTGRLPFRVSGILYRPFPHYHTFPMTQLTPALELKRTRQALILKRACRHPQLETLYWLDPYGARYMNDKTTPINVWLPDPVELSPVSPEDIQRVRENLGVTEQHRVWLVFGADIVRKGTREILRALPADDQAKDVTLALVGPVYSGQEQWLQQAVSAARTHFKGRIVVDLHFVPEADVPAYFSAASLVLTLYQGHMGSSGALVRAAAAGRPVLSTDFGLLGQLTHRHHLGFTCNVQHETALRHALRLAASGAMTRAFNPEQAQTFARNHDKFAFSKRLLAQA